MLAADGNEVHLQIVGILATGCFGIRAAISQHAVPPNTIGTLFATLHAMAHVWQPMHIPWSMTIP